MLSFLFQTRVTLRRLSFSLIIFCIVNLCGWQTARAAVQLDNTFVPVLGGRNAGLSSVLVLPDGKLVALRQSNQNLLGDEEYRVTRFNADGSIEQTFNSVVLSRSDGKLLLQPDGRILVLSSGIIANGVNRGGLVRLNADGTLDTSFNPDGIPFASGGAIQPDGKIIVGTTRFIQSHGTTVGATYRLNADGSYDQSFTPYTPYGFAAPTVVTLQPDGKILLGFGRLSSTYRIQRLNADGTLDTAFSNNLSAISGSAALNGASAIVVQSDGKIVIGGSGIIRLNSDGTRDLAFPAYNIYGGYDVLGMIRQPDDKIIIGGSGWYSYSSTTLKKRLTRINADGTPDNTFDAMTSERLGFDSLVPLALKPNGGILVGNGALTQMNVRRVGLFSLNPNGIIDQSFTTDLGLIAGSVSLLKAQPDGKILIGGYFSQVNNFPTFGIARLNPDGTTDTDFSFSEQITDTYQGIGFLPVTIAFQADGKILIGGNFRFNGQDNYGVFRLNQNGSIDSTFTAQTFTPYPNPAYSIVYAIALQADGKILVGGGFQNYGNSGRNILVRLNTDGSVDTSYTATSTGISEMFIQPGGKIVVSGTVTENGNTRTNPRLNPGGTIDPTFNMPTDVGYLYAVAPDGKLATSGFFPNGNEQVRYVFRLNPDGSRDLSFVPQRFFDNVADITFQNDGRMIISHSYKITRIDGTDRVETLFTQTGGGADITTLLVTPGDKLIVGGRIRSLAGARRTGIARFSLGNSDFDYDGDGKADLSVFRPSAGDWYLSRSSDGAFAGIHFGAAGDLIAPADFDGDGRTDICVFRPTDGSWYRLNSSDNSFAEVQFGADGDLPVPGDFDGDGRADVSIYRPSAGSWYRLNSSGNQSVGVQFGISEDKPLVGDFDGDGKSDLTVFRPSNGTWYRINSSNDSFSPNQFGASGDLPVAADYDGDGKTDLAVYRPSVGDWYIINSSNSAFIAAHFGIVEDKPAPADFDGDGRADLVVFRPSSGTWYLLRTTAGFTGAQFGATGDIPTPNAFVR